MKRRWRGPKDDRIKALQTFKRRHRYEVVQGIAENPNPARVSQPITRGHRMTPPSVDSPLQCSPCPTVPRSPPAGDYENEQVSFDDSLVSSDVPLESGLQAASGGRNNRALLRQTKHLDDETSAWNERRNSQATQWKLVAIPRLMLPYLANRVATKSGRLTPPPPPPKPITQCQCNKVALKVELVTWDSTFSPHLLQLFADCVLHQDPRRKYCLSASAILLVYS